MLAPALGLPETIAAPIRRTNVNGNGKGGTNANANHDEKEKKYSKTANTEGSTGTSAVATCQLGELCCFMEGKTYESVVW